MLVFGRVFFPKGIQPTDFFQDYFVEVQLKEFSWSSKPRSSGRLRFSREMPCSQAVAPLQQKPALVGCLPNYQICSFTQIVLA